MLSVGCLGRAWPQLLALLKSDRAKKGLVPVGLPLSSLIPNTIILRRISSREGELSVDIMDRLILDLLHISKYLV